MSTPFKNPPLQEAVLAISFTEEAEWDATIPGQLYEKISTKFSKKRSLTQIGLEVDLTKQPKPLLQEHRKEITRFSNDDEKDLIQIGAFFLSISRIKPYIHWDNFKENIDYIISIYDSLSVIKKIKRIGLRYINNIIFEKPINTFSDYFNFYPKVGEKFPTKIGPFLVGVQIPYNSKDILKVELTLAKQDFTSFILDLDYFSLDNTALTIGNTSPWIISAHDRIEEIFLDSCTKQLISLFNK